MCDHILRKWVAVFAALLISPMTSLFAQELPKSDDDPFEIEPPLLVPPDDVNREADELRAPQPDIAQLAKQLERAKKSAASAERLVKVGVLAKAEAEQRELRAVRLASELANAQMVAAKEEVTLRQSSSATGPANKAELDAAIANLTRASAEAQSAEETYRRAQLDAAALNLRRQRQLLALGSAHKSDVARAEKKLATLQRDDQPSR